MRAQRYRGRIEHIVIDGGSGDDVVAPTCPGVKTQASRIGSPSPTAGGTTRPGHRASGDLLWFLRPPIVFRARRGSPGRGGAIRQGPVSGNGASGWIISSGSIRLHRYLSACAEFTVTKACCSASASVLGSSLVAKIVASTTLIFGIAADQNSLLQAALVYEAGHIRYCAVRVSTPRSAAPGTSAVFGDLRRMGDSFIAKPPVRGRRITCRGREFYAWLVDSGKTSSARMSKPIDAPARNRWKEMPSYCSIRPLREVEGETTQSEA